MPMAELENSPMDIQSYEADLWSKNMRFRSALEHIASYWNGSETQMALSDAVIEMREAARSVLNRETNR